MNPSHEQNTLNWQLNTDKNFYIKNRACLIENKTAYAMEIDFSFYILDQQAIQNQTHTVGNEISIYVGLIMNHDEFGNITIDRESIAPNFIIESYTTFYDVSFNPPHEGYNSLHIINRQEQAHFYDFVLNNIEPSVQEAFSFQQGIMIKLDDFQYIVQSILKDMSTVFESIRNNRLIAPESISFFTEFHQSESLFDISKHLKDETIKYNAQQLQNKINATLAVGYDKIINKI